MKSVLDGNFSPPISSKTEVKFEKTCNKFTSGYKTNNSYIHMLHVQCLCTMRICGDERKLHKDATLNFTCTRKWTLHVSDIVSVIDDIFDKMKRESVTWRSNQFRIST